MWEQGARRRELEEGTQMDTRQLRRQRKDTQRGKHGNSYGRQDTEGARPNTDMTGETHTEDMADSHRRHRKETEPKKTDTNKLNSIKKLNSRLN